MKHRAAVGAKGRIRRLQIEHLEPRQMMSALPVTAANGHPAGCTCPACVQVQDELGTIAAQTFTVASEVAPGDSDPVPAPTLLHSLSEVPALNSLPGALVTLYLDFNGNFDATWGSRSNITTPAYDQDGDPTTFSDGELASIQQMWRQVAEDYAPFNINVSTVEPPSFANGVALRVAVGGDGTWTGGTYGGISYVDAFTNALQNVSFVFSKNLANNPKYTAEAISHEAGHSFGLQHQSQYSGTAKVAEYYAGPGDGTAPIMGNSYYATRGLWWNGPNSAGSTVIQDDMAIISRAQNGFGYRPDDYGNSTAAATTLSTQYDQAAHASTVSISGVITTTSDTDWFRFSTSGGQVTLTVTPPAGINNLDATLAVYNSAGQLVASADPSDTFSATVDTVLDDGQYYVVVGSHGHYGDVGQYTLSGITTRDQSYQSVLYPTGGGASSGSSASALVTTDLAVGQAVAPPESNPVITAVVTDPVEPSAEELRKAERRSLRQMARQLAAFWAEQRRARETAVDVVMGLNFDRSFGSAEDIIRRVG